MNKLLSMAFSVVFVATLGLGCSGGGDSNLPKTYPVSGTVTQAGQPVAGATVKFSMADGSRSAVGMTDDRGKYTLMTFSPGDGAVPGEYNVSIAKYDRPAAASGSSGNVADTGDEPPEEPETGPAGDDEAEGPKTLLPEKYADPKTSGLKATVAEASNEHDFKVD
jgi:hypothetical protein